MDSSAKIFALDLEKDVVMPDGSPGVRPLDSQEAAGWLRLILFGNASPLADRKAARDSLKTTLLSYAAKRGLDISLRLQLGYRTQPFRMGLTYSRDGAAASISALEDLLREIKIGTFMPDETRSGRIRKEQDGSFVSPIVIKDEEEAEIEGGLDTRPTGGAVSSDAHAAELELNDVDSGSDSTSGSEMEETTYEPTTGVGKFQPPSAPAGFHMFQHKKSRILHLMDDAYRNTFVCGRAAGPLHTKEGLHPRYDTPICWSCFNKAH